MYMDDPVRYPLTGTQELDYLFFYQSVFPDGDSYTESETALTSNL
jgi:hypothetical protein